MASRPLPALNLNAKFLKPYNAERLMAEYDLKSIYSHFGGLLEAFIETCQGLHFQ